MPTEPNLTKLITKNSKKTHRSFICWPNWTIMSKLRHVSSTARPISLTSTVFLTCHVAGDLTEISYKHILTSHHTTLTAVDEKLSYPQRKRASNTAILYGADGISIWNRIGMDHECDRETANVCSVAPSSNQYKMPSSTRSKGIIAFGSFWPVFNTLVQGEPLNTGPRNLASRN